MSDLGIRPGGKETHSLVPASDHGTHAQTHALVAVHQVAEILGRSCNGYPLSITQLMQAALNAEVGFPVLAIGCVTRRVCDASASR